MPAQLAPPGCCVARGVEDGGERSRQVIAEASRVETAESGSSGTMSTATRLPLAGLLTAAIAVVIGTTAVPTHVTFGAGSMRCGTVLRPERNSEIAEPPWL